MFHYQPFRIATYRTSSYIIHQLKRQWMQVLYYFDLDCGFQYLRYDEYRTVRRHKAFFFSLCSIALLQLTWDCKPCPQLFVLSPHCGVLDVLKFPIRLWRNEIPNVRSTTGAWADTKNVSQRWATSIQIVAFSKGWFGFVSGYGMEINDVERLKNCECDWFLIMLTVAFMNWQKIKVIDWIPPW